MNETNPFGVTLEHILDSNSTWCRQQAQSGETLYTLMHPERNNLSLTPAQWSGVHDLLPVLLGEIVKSSPGNPELAGRLLRANLQMRENLAPPGLSKYCLRREMQYLLWVSEVCHVSAENVDLCGHFLNMEERGSHGPMAMGIIYMRVQFSAETLEAYHPGIMERLSTLAAMGLSASELAQQMFRMDAPPAEGLHLPSSLADFTTNN